MRRVLDRLTRWFRRTPARRSGPSWFARHPRLTRGVGLAVVFFGCFGLGGAIGAWTLVCRSNRCPAVTVLDSYQPSQTSKLYAVDGRFVAELGIERRTLVQYDDIPPVVRNAFVQTEDKRFFSHGGIDWLRIPGSMLANLRQGAFAEGFSTITMQLARNVFPDQISRERSVSLGSLVRKIRESRVAMMIEARYPKQKILELYLNQINLGSGAFGIETASQRYFGKSVRDLNLAEAATLAAIPKAPTRYNPRRYPDRAIMRRNTIIELMRRQGSISDDDASLAKAYPLQLAQRTESGDVAPYFVEWVRQQLEKKFGERLYDEGLRVYTTLDLDLQTAADRALETQMRTIESGKYGKYSHTTMEQYLARGGGAQTSANPESPYLQGAFVALDPRTGAVRALIGGRDYDDSKFNRATQALRQPGSTFKPIVYATAVMNGRAPATVYDDSPIALPQVDGSIWSPRNYDGKYEGPMTMRTGFAQSRNIVAIRAGMDVGESAVIQMARAFGLQTFIPPYPSIFIGSADVYPIQLIASYSTFANLGMRSTPNAILRVENQRGEVLWKPAYQSEEVMSPSAAWLIVDMMKGVVQRGTAAGSVWGAGFHVPSGGKTGTTNDGADVWYVGYTADLVAGVWMGFDAPKKIMPNAQGGRLAAPAFTQFMLEVYRRKPVPPDWPRPDGVVFASTCGGPLQAGDYFLAGTESAACAANPFQIQPHVDTAAARPAALPVAPKPQAKARSDSTNPFRIPR
ncbi:MAG: PBP1A family penicillin-binding protein [Gemmatimonadaceae bacterium]|nr:PBP1A family penicillin-binding protein [Gemmatimonadaceae bacterium]